MQLTIVRHTAVAVEPGVCYGQTDVALRPSFPDEAAAVSRKLAGQTFDAVFCSPLSRCTRLAAYCGFDDAVRDKRLMEMNFGDWEMKRYDEISDPRLEEWYDDFFSVRATGGESFDDQGARVKEFVDELRAKGADNVLIFTHGGVVMQLLLLAGIATHETIFNHQPGYGSVTRLTI